MRSRLAFLSLLALLFSAIPVLANPYGIPDNVDAHLKKTYDYLFNLRFEDARKEYDLIKGRANEHPMVALGEVVIQWWELSVTVRETDIEASEPFLNASEYCMEVAEEMIADGDKKAEGLTALGTTLGLLSRWSAANRTWLSAYARGKRSARYLEKALHKNPKATDAYMALGTFNYARELIQKSMTIDKNDSGIDQTRGLGVDQLRKAYKEGVYFRQASGLLLAGLLTNEKPSDAIPLLRDLREDLPESGFVQMVLISALYNTGQIEEMDSEIKTFIEKISTGTYSESFLIQARFAQGLSAMRKKHWIEAAEFFSKASESGDEKNPYTTWSVLYKGYMLDVMGKREQAKKQYDKVLKMKRRFASHDHAKARLSRPFRSTDPEMKKLEL